MPEVPVACSMKPHGNGGAKNWREGCQASGENMGYSSLGVVL